MNFPAVKVSVDGSYQVRVDVGEFAPALVRSLALAEQPAAPPLYRLPRWKVESLWSLAELGQTVDWGLLEYGLPEAFRTHRGEGVLVAILDTGVQEDHPDLVGQFAEEPKNFTNSQGTFDLAGHGTHCAGIVAASDNGQGVVGVAPSCQLLIGKVLGDDGSGYGEWIANGLDWAADRGAHVISMSLGSPYADPVIYSAIKRVVGKGCLVICAAGNSGPHNPTDIDYPGRHDEAVAIASVMKGGALSKFSSRGPHVAFAAPGENILSTFPPGRYARLSGTSMATPFIAGVAALYIGAHGLARIGRDAFVNALKPHAIDSGETGHDSEYGWGVVRVDELLKPEPPVVPPPVDDGGFEINLPYFGKVAIYAPARAGDLFSVGRG